MTLMTMTPFGQRPVTAALIDRARLAADDTPLPPSDKWELLRALTTGRAAFGISDRDLSVLNALLSFHPERILQDNNRLVVFPSNAALADRAHGMAESTLRRHLAALVSAGLLRRHDSPNGKRYAARDRSGSVVRAFGFDLRPLLARAEEIAAAAEDAVDKAERLRRLREEVLVVRRDALKLLEYARNTGHDVRAFEAGADMLRQGLRRRLEEPGLLALLAQARETLSDLHICLETGIPGGDDSQNERHHQNSRTDYLDKEEALEQANDSTEVPCSPGLKPKKAEKETARPSDHTAPTVPLSLVLRACPEIATFTGEAPRSWRDLVRSACKLRPMLGISSTVWNNACRQMGTTSAAITLAAMLQRFDRLRSPNGYLCALARQAEERTFSPGPMIMALLNEA